MNHSVNFAWLYKEGKLPESVLIGATKELKRSELTGKTIEIYKPLCKNKDQLVSLLEELIKEDGRYHIKWTWERSQFGRFNGNKGHIITAERINGKLRYYDPQNGKIIENLASYTRNLDLNRGIRFLRVDNLQVNPDWARKILTTSGAKSVAGKVAEGGTDAVRKDIKDEIATGIKARNSAQTNKEKVAIDLRIINHPDFVEAKEYSARKGGGKVFAPEAITKEILDENVEYKKNLEMAQKMAKNGYNVYLLSNPNNVKSADMILEKGGKVYYTEAKLSTGKNSLNHNFEKGGKQAERVLVDMTGTDDTRYLYGEIKNAFDKNVNLKEIKLLKGSREISIPRQFVYNSSFEKRFKKIWEQRK